MRRVPTPLQPPARAVLTPLKWLRFLMFPLALAGGLAVVGAFLAGLVVVPAAYSGAQGLADGIRRLREMAGNALGKGVAHLMTGRFQQDQ